MISMISKKKAQISSVGVRARTDPYSSLSLRVLSVPVASAQTGIEMRASKCAHSRARTGTCKKLFAHG